MYAHRVSRTTRRSDEATKRRSDEATKREWISTWTSKNVPQNLDYVLISTLGNEVRSVGHDVCPRVGRTGSTFVEESSPSILLGLFHSRLLALSENS